MKTVKNIFRYIMSIVLAISIIGLVIIHIATSTVLNEKYLLNQLEKNNYYGKIHEKAISSFENYIYQSGLDEKVLEDIVSEEKIKEDTNKMISNIFHGIEEEIDIQQVKDQMSTNIDKSVQNIYNRKLTTTEQKAVDTLINKLAKEYTNTILHFSVEKQINNIYSKIVKLIDLAQKGLCISAGVSIIVLILLSLRRIYKLFTMVGISLMSSGAFFIISNIIINSKVKVDAITLLNEGLSDVIKNTLANILSSVNNYGIILVLGGFVLAIIANSIHNALKYKEEENSQWK